MPWQLVVILGILFGSFLFPFVARLLGDTAPRERIYRIAVQYGFAAVFAIMITLFSGPFHFSQWNWQIALVGALMPIGVFFQWRAYVWSLSRSAIFEFSTHFIPLFLSAIFLGEWLVFRNNWLLTIGFVAAMLGVGLHMHQDILDRNRHKDTEALPVTFYLYALGFMVIFGLAMFLLNYWAKTGIGTSGFLVSWYLGAFAGALVLLLFTRHLPRAAQLTLSRGKEHILLGVSAIAIVLSLWLSFLAFQLVEQTVALPIFAVGGIVGPVFLGIVIFREWRAIRGRGWVYFSLGLLGVILMVLSR